MKATVEFVSLLFRSADARLLPLSILTGLVLAAVALSFVVFFRAKALVRGAEQRANTCHNQLQTELELLRESHQALATELRDFRQHPPISMIPAAPKRGLNMTTRSQALRMHRLGDPPARIAAALEIPPQQLDLLLKVHRIVITNI